jgi:hypothetical protein
MQLHKADLENLFYGWLARKACQIAAFSWRMYRRPKLRGILVLTLYISLHNAVLTVLTGLLRDGKITDPTTIRRINSYKKRVKETIDRRCDELTLNTE